MRPRLPVKKAAPAECGGVRVPPDLRAAAVALALRHGETLSDVVRRALAAAVVADADADRRDPP